MAKKNTKSRYWVDDNSILPEIVITPQGNYPVLDEAGNPARTVGAIQDINPNAHIYERVNTQPFMDDYIEGETNAAANQRADALDAQVVPHIGDFVGAAAKPLDVLMPSRWVGLLDKDYDGLSAVDRFSRLFDENNRGLFINDNPYGLFSKQYAEEHPYWAMAGNTAFDVASTPFIWNGANKVYNTEKTAYNTGRNAVSLPTKITEKNAASSSYQIEHYPGYQLKSLMTGNTLEKQLSKNGTISVNSIKAHVNKGSNVEKTVVDKVLSSEQFAGKKAVDYNEFRKAVQDELITYERVPSEEWANYGIEKLGFTDQRLTDDRAFNRNWDNYYNELARNWPRSTHEQRVEEVNRVIGPRRTVIDLNTFTFESPRIPIGNAKHYRQSTLGHSRTYTTEDEPEVLHVMESQSDWAQNKPTELLKTHDIKTLQDWEEEMAFQKANAGQGYKGVDYNQEMRDLEAARAFVDPETSYLAENYERRQLQENLKFAAEHGQTKMRYPTSETAAKIEGYPTRKGYIFDKKAYNKIVNDLVESNPESKKLDNKILEEFKQDIRDSLNTWFYQGYTDEDIIVSLRLRGLKCSPEVKKYISNARASFREGDVYRPEHETILKKYSDFPKQYRKLYKDAEVRTVTDNKGNTWYEVDVPKDYLNQEWRYGLIPWLLGAGTAAGATYGASKQDNNVKAYGGLLDMANKFKDGGSKNDYNTWKKKIKDYKGIIVNGDDTYDYYNFFKDNPQMAWDMLSDNPEAHFIDKYKTPNHPTFSDESMYSRPPYIQGGTWNDYSPTVIGQKWNYALSPSQVNSNWDVERTINYLASAENEGAYVTDNNGRYPIVDGTVLGGTLTPVTITPNNHSQGGPLKSALWNDLSIKEKADIIKVGVKHGLNRLADIKSKYNEFALGGNLYDEGGPKTRMTADGRTLTYSTVPSTGEVRWIDFDDSKDFDGVTGYRFYDNAGNKMHYTQWQDTADYLGTEEATGYVLPEVEVLGKDLAMRRHRHLDDPLLGGELKNNQYRTMPTNSEANSYADSRDSVYDLTPYVANFMTLGYASQAENGWNTLLDENSSWRQKASGLAEVISPAMFTSPWARAYYGLTHLADENGVQKTWDRFSNGDYVGGAKSAAGDFLNLMLAGEGGYNSANNFLNFMASKGSPNSWDIGFGGRAIVDGLIRPLSTYRAIKNGQYIYDFPSLMRNVRSARNEINAGIESTNNHYLNLTDMTIPKVQVKIDPWRDFKFFTGGHYTPSERIIHIPLTRSNFSNIRTSSSGLRNVGAHEQAHAANDFLNSLFGTPRLGMYKDKIFGFLPNDYYIPNRNHPISNKYYWKFMRGLISHGRSPEETWANYMGAKAAGKSKLGYYLDNFNNELMFPPKGFIQDYETYLSNTYRPIAWFFK